MTYIQLNKNSLLISKLKKQKNKFLLINPKTINFKNLEINKGILFNPSKIYAHIKKYLKKENIKKSFVIISNPNLESTNKLQLIQTALCISKTGLKIKKIINNPILKKENKMPFSSFFYKKDLENKLDFFKDFAEPKNSPPFKWITLLCFSSIFLTIILLIIQKNKLYALKTIQNKNIQITNINNHLKKKLSTLNLLKSKTSKIKQKIKKIKKIKRKQNNPKEIAVALAKNISKNSYIDRIKVDKNINIYGYSKNQQEITKLIKNLKKTSPFKKLKLINIKKAAEKDLYNFEFSTKVKSKLHS